MFKFHLNNSYNLFFVSLVSVSCFQFLFDVFILIVKTRIFVVNVKSRVVAVILTVLFYRIINIVQLENFIVAIDCEDLWLYNKQNTDSFSPPSCTP